jgi:oligopeptide/dipeptide ABC transporter ATP-binding protein
MTALNPVFTVGDQIAEVLTTHGRASSREAWAEAIDLLDRVGIPAPAERVHEYPHSLSGGMRQRVMIAMALACRPALLIADEPTTALDVTVQAQIIELLQELQADMGMAILFISHDLGVVSEIADEIVVMYAGRIVERASAGELFSHPRHPYTRALFETIPRIARRQRRLPTIAGSVSAPGAWPSGCRFRDRCPLAEDRCAEAEPELKTVVFGHSVACVVAAP